MYGEATYKCVPGKILNDRYRSCTVRKALILCCLVAFAGCTAKPTDEVNEMTDLQLTSPVFDNGERIPEKYGYTEQNVNPPLQITGVPEGAVSLALVMDDPDAQPVAGKVWDHWVAWNIDPSVSTIEEDSVPSGAVEGETDYGEIGYGGPNPPDQEHTYVFKLYALDTELDLAAGATKDELEEAMEGHILAETRLEGTYAT